MYFTNVNGHHLLTKDMCEVQWARFPPQQHLCL